MRYRRAGRRYADRAGEALRHLAAAHITASVDASLRLMGIERIDCC
jgi:aryl-alcohol dehydrogenase-like predicted oxidoreductase